MLRGLVLLLLLLASYLAPPLQGVTMATEEVRASQLASELVATLDKRGPTLSGAVERLPTGPAPPPPPASASVGSIAQLVLFDRLEVVVQESTPRVVPVAREVAQRDQRPGIRRLKHRAPSLDTASSNA